LRGSAEEVGELSIDEIVNATAAAKMKSFVQEIVSIMAMSIIDIDQDDTNYNPISPIYLLVAPPATVACGARLASDARQPPPFSALSSDTTFVLVAGKLSGSST